MQLKLFLFLHVITLIFKSARRVFIINQIVTYKNIDMTDMDKGINQQVSDENNRLKGAISNFQKISDDNLRLTKENAKLWEEYRLSF